MTGSGTPGSRGGRRSDPVDRPSPAGPADAADAADAADSGDSADPPGDARGAGTDETRPAPGTPSAAAAWSAVWRLLNRILMVPLDPPEPPPGRRTWIRTFRPDPAFLRYLVVTAMIQTVAVMVIAVGFGTVMVVGIDESPPPLVVAAALLVLALVAFGGALAILTARLRYDATWYVMTDRSLRNRRGVWTIRENTVSFDNIQNLRVRQGPIQRWFGIEDLILETAAAGASQADEGAQASRCVVEGIRGARELRDRIADRMRRSGTGLGEGPNASPPPAPDPSGASLAPQPVSPPSPDEIPPSASGVTEGPVAAPLSLGPDHLRLLEEILGELRTLRARSARWKAGGSGSVPGSGEGPPQD